MLDRTFRRLARSRRAAERLFGVRLPEPLAGEHFFDATTLALRQAAKTFISEGQRVLDVGTGSAAVLGLWLWKRGCQVTCTEPAPAIAARARECLRLNGAPLEVRETAYLEGLDGPFDWVLHNPPYVPTGAGERDGLPASHRSQWDGGPDGTRVLAGFLDAFAERGGHARALLGVNSRHVGRSAVEDLLARRPRLRLLSVRTLPLWPALVYVLVRNESPIASASSPEA